jgi:hypothetical protein
MRHEHGGMMATHRHGSNAHLFQRSKTPADSIQHVLNIVAIIHEESTSLIHRKTFPFLNLQFDFSVNRSWTVSGFCHFDQWAMNSWRWGIFLLLGFGRVNCRDLGSTAAMKLCARHRCFPQSDETIALNSIFWLLMHENLRHEVFAWI